MGLEVRYEEGKGAVSSGERLRKVVLGSWGQSAGVGMGLPQSLQSYPGAEAVGAICAAPGNSWLPWEEAVGGKLCLSVDTFQWAESCLPMDGLPQMIVSSPLPEAYKQKAGTL